VGLFFVTKNKPKIAQLWRAIFLGLSLPTTLMILISAIQVPFQRSLPIFRNGEEVEVFNWLREETENGSVVLSSFETGNALPAWAPMKVVIGHGPETANGRFLERQVKAFYTDELEVEEQIEFFQSQNISYLFVGPLERGYGEKDLSISGQFTLRFEAGVYQLYEVYSSK
jgi:hypothetical protein